MKIKVDDLVQTEDGTQYTVVALSDDNIVAEDSNGHLLLLPYGEFGLVEN